MTEDWQKKHIDTENGQIFYFTNGKKDRPAIIFLHGLSANHRTWIKIISLIKNPNDYNIIAPDLRGHGLSDKTIKKSLYGFDIFIDDLVKIIDNEDVTKSAFIGYSFGGSLAIDFALKHPDRLFGVMLISSFYRSPIGKLMTFFMVSALNIVSLFFIWQGKKEYIYHKPERYNGYWNSTWSGLKSMPWSVNLWILAMILKKDFSKDISKIRIPIWLIHSNNDKLIPEKERKSFAELLNDCTVVTSKNENHFIASQSQEEMASIIYDFIKKYENSNL